MDFRRVRFSNIQYDLIAVTETWFKPLFTDKMAQINGYNRVRNDRKDRRAGKIALYIKSHMNYRILAYAMNSALDFFAAYLICELNLNSNTKIFVAVVYRPPNTPFYKGTNFLKVIPDLSQDYSSKVILWDFNSNMLTINPESTIMNEFIKSNNLFLIDHGITHVKNDYVSQLDLCMVDANDSIINFSKSDGPFTHHHFLILATLKIFIPSSTRLNFSYRNLEKIDSAAHGGRLGILGLKKM